MKINQLKKIKLKVPGINSIILNFNKNKGNNPPLLVTVLFSVLLAVTTFNLFNDISSWGGIRPFGFLESVIAQLLGDDIPEGMKTSSLGKFFAEDINDRCQIANPSYEGQTLDYWPGWSQYFGESKFGVGNADPSDWNQFPEYAENTCSPNEVDILSYLLPRAPATRPIERRTCDLKVEEKRIALGLDVSQVVRGTVNGDNHGFYVRRGNNYSIYTYDEENLYLYGERKISDFCEDGATPAYVRYFEEGGDDKKGAAFPRCMEPMANQFGDGDYYRIYQDSRAFSTKISSQRYEVGENGDLTDTSCAETTNTGDYYLGLFLANNPDKYGPAGLEDGDTILTVHPGGGVFTYYSKDANGEPLGITALKTIGTSGVVAGHIKGIFSEEENTDITLWCAENGGPELEAQGIKPMIADVQEEAFEAMDKFWLNCNLDSCLYPRTEKTGLDVLRTDLGSGSESGGIIIGDPELIVGENIGGSNLGIVIESGVNDAVRSAVDHAKGMGFSYILGMAQFPQSIDPTISFINFASENGLIPIIRLCFPGSCGFHTSDDMVSFYNGVAAGTGNNFLAVLGPNEPGTANEIYEFIGDSYKPTDGSDVVPELAYNTMIDITNTAASSLQHLRDKGIGLSPAIFNIGNPVNNDAKHYLETGTTINKDLFTHLMGNAYWIGGKGPYQYYIDGGGQFALKQYVDSNGLKMVIAEFGMMDGGGEGVLKEDFGKFCEDPNVEGILFFRSFESLQDTGLILDPHPQLLTDAQVAEIVEGCDGATISSLDSSSGADSTLDPYNTAYACGRSPYYEPSVNVLDYNVVTTASSTGCLSLDTDKPVKLIKIGDSIANDPRFYPDSESSLNATANGASTRWFLCQESGGEKDSMCSKFNTLATVNTSDASYVAVIILGTNDCGGLGLDEFAGNMKEMGNRLSANGIEPLFVTIPARRNSQNVCLEGSSEEYNSALKSMAADNGWEIIDAHELIPDEYIRGDDFHIDNEDYGNMDSPGYSMLNDMINGMINCSSSNNRSGTGTAQVIAAKEPEAFLTVICDPVFTRTDYINFKDGNTLNSYLYGGASLSQFSTGKQGQNVDIYDFDEHYCYTRGQSTLEVKLPIKSFGSNAGYGTSFRSYVPASAEVASFMGLEQYDAQNQFAGRLVNSGQKITYPMPWLGSAINSMSEFIKYDWRNFSMYGGLKVFASLGSETSESSDELYVDITKDLARHVFDASWIKNFDEKKDMYQISDERAYYIDTFAPTEELKEKVLDKIFVQQSTQFTDYDPFKIPQEFEQVSNTSSISGRVSCQDAGLIVVNDKSDYIVGPELNIEESEKKMENTFGTDICFDYARRNIDESVKEKMLGDMHYDCSIRKGLLYHVKDGIVVQCEALANSCSPVDIRDGLCDAGYEYKDCFMYSFKVNRRDNEAIYVKSTDFAGSPVIDIPEAYEALHREYLSLQTELSRRSRSIVFRENMGWDSIVSVKMRDSGRGLGTLPEYLYNEDLGNECSVPDLITNEFPLAKGNPVISEKQYYDWVGYIDLMQEYKNLYASGSTWPVEDYHPNPVFRRGDKSKIVYQKEKILVANAANLLLSKPLYTCDQLEVCKEMTAADIKQFLLSEGYNAEDANWVSYRMCLFEGLLDESSQYTCVTDTGNTTNPDEEYCISIPGGETITNVCYDTSDIPVSCPLISGRSRSAASCTQGPNNDTISHLGMDAVDLAVPDGEGQVVAPFEGRIVDAKTGHSDGFSYCKNGQNAGGAIWYQGEIVPGKLVTMFIYHVEVESALKLMCSNYSEGMDAASCQPRVYRAGEPIVTVSKEGRFGVTTSSCWGGEHVHIELTDNNPPYRIQYISPSGGPLISNAVGVLTSLGCSMETGINGCFGDCSGKFVVEGEYDPSSDSGINILSSGGVSFTMDMEDITLYSSHAGDIPTQITSFAELNDLDVVINSNFFSARDGLQLGFVGGGNDFLYRNLLSPNLEVSIVHYSSSTKMSDISELSGIVIADNGNYALIDIRQNERDKQLLVFPGVQNEDKLKIFNREHARLIIENGLLTASSGLPILVFGGEPLYDLLEKYPDPDLMPPSLGWEDSRNQYNWQHGRPRTIIGWKEAERDLIFAVLDPTNASSDMEELRLNTNTAYQELGLDFALALDGGGSSQMYSKAGFPEGLDAAKISSGGKVFYPSIGQSLRSTFFIGAKLNSASDNGSGGDQGEGPGETSGNYGSQVCFATSESLYYDKLGDELCKRGYILPDACPGYQRGLDDDYKPGEREEKDYNTIFDLAEAVGESMDVPPEKLIAIVSAEARSEFISSIGDHIKDGTAMMSGDPYEQLRFMEDLTPAEQAAMVSGPMNLQCSHFLAYGYPQGAENDRGCEDPIAGLGSFYSTYIDSYTGVSIKGAIQCVQDIGMDVRVGDKLEPTVVGHAFCVSAAILKRDLVWAEIVYNKDVDLYTDFQPEYGVQTIGWGEENPYWSNSFVYCCGAGEFSCDICSPYSNMVWGRQMVLKLKENEEGIFDYWQCFKDGECEFDLLQNYLVTLGD